MQSGSASVPSAVGEQASLLASWVQIAYRTARQYGLEADRIFEDAGIDTDKLYLPESRIKSSKVKQVWDRSSQLSGDAAFAIRAANAAYPGMYHSLSVALGACASLRDVLEKLMRYRRIVDTQSVNTLVESPDGQLKFTWAPIINYESPVGAEAMIACVIQLCRWSIGHQFAPTRVTLQREDAGCGSEYRRFFNAPVEFDAEENALHFSPQNLSLPLLTANRVIAAKNEQLTADYLSRVLRGDTINTVYSLMLSNIDKRKFSIELISEEMNLTPRTLQRKLKLAGTSYESLLNELRREVALQYINQQVSIQEIGHMLGYSNASNFSRAFRRWTNLSPNTYRQQKNIR